MRTTLTSTCMMLMGLLVCGVSLSAHHGSAVFDTAKTVTVKGRVTQFLWTNPHILLRVDSVDDNGKAVHWLIEHQAPANMANFGWTKTMFKAGDDVEIDVTPVKNYALQGTTIGRFRERIVINGHEFKPGEPINAKP